MKGLSKFSSLSLPFSKLTGRSDPTEGDKEGANEAKAEEGLRSTAEGGQGEGKGEEIQRGVGAMVGAGKGGVR